MKKNILYVGIGLLLQCIVFSSVTAQRNSSLLIEDANFGSSTFSWARLLSGKNAYINSYSHNLAKLNGNVFMVTQTDESGIGIATLDHLAIYITPEKKNLPDGEGGKTTYPGGQVVIGNGIYPNGGFGLTVKDGIAAFEVLITNNGWADYVFKPQYTLKPLEEIEDFINKNKHLPEIPSQREIEKKGLDMGPMMKLHMQKIEELTLYLIAQQKEIEELENKVALSANSYKQ